MPYLTEEEYLKDLTEYKLIVDALDVATRLLDYSGCDSTGGRDSIPDRNFVFHVRDQVLTNKPPRSWYSIYKVEWAKYIAPSNI